jgi:NDP-sugar pyrophosphorylase family protein
MTRRAVVLVGGKGTRLLPYTIVLPKPLMPLGEFPILEIVIRQLVFYGFSRITLAVNHQAQLIQSFFQDGKKWGALIDYSLEDSPLGTMGPLQNIADLPEDFLVMNGDVLTDLNFSDFLDSHTGTRSNFTISAQTRKQLVDFGVLETDKNGFLTKFIEKPNLDYLVSMGVYGIQRATLEMIPKGQPFGFDDLMLKMLSSNLDVQTVVHDGYWLDIGRPSDYEQAIEDFDKMRGLFIRE